MNFFLLLLLFNVDNIEGLKQHWIYEGEYYNNSSILKNGSKTSSWGYKYEGEFDERENLVNGKITYWDGSIEEGEFYNIYDDNVGGYDIYLKYGKYTNPDGFISEGEFWTETDLEINEDAVPMLKNGIKTSPGGLIEYGEFSINGMLEKGHEYYTNEKKIVFVDKKLEKELTKKDNIVKNLKEAIQYYKKTLTKKDNIISNNYNNIIILFFVVIIIIIIICGICWKYKKDFQIINFQKDNLAFLITDYVIEINDKDNKISNNYKELEKLKKEYEKKNEDLKIKLESANKKIKEIEEKYTIDDSQILIKKEERKKAAKYAKKYKN